MEHKHEIPSIAAARLHSYVIEFKPTKQHANADGLSRLPLGNSHEASLDCIIVDAFTNSRTAGYH